MSDLAVVDTGGPSLSADEEAFFASGGEKEIPKDDGVAAGESGETVAAKVGEKTAEGAPKADHVPLATFLEEKKGRKELSTKLTEAEKQIAELRGKFSIIDRLKLGGDAVDPTAPVVPPTAEEDIFGAVKHVTESLAQIQKRDAEAKTAKEATEKAAADQKVFVDKYKSDAETFEKATPDYRDGYNFLLNSRAAELKAIGYDTPEKLHNALIADEFAIAQMAFDQGKSPAELIYNLANQRGYKKAAATNSKSGEGAERLDTIERGQNANKSLSNTGGAAGDQDMTAEALIAMPADEFEAWCNKNPAKARRIFGG